MTRLVWNSEQTFNANGVDRGVLYFKDGSIVVWNGLSSVTEKVKAEVFSFYLNGVKRLNRMSLDEFEATVEAFTYPDELETKEIAAFAYRAGSSDSRYQLHMVYNPTFSQDERSFNGFNNTVETTMFSWNLTVKAKRLVGYAPTSHLILDSLSKNPSWFLIELQNLLFGSAITEPRLLEASQIVNLFKEVDTYSELLILDNGDGTWTAMGSDETVSYLDDSTFQIDSDSVTYLDADTYTVSSM